MKFFQGIDAADPASVQQVIQNTKDRLKITKGLNTAEREKARLEREAARVCAEKACENPMAEHLIDLFLKTSKIPDGGLIGITGVILSEVQDTARFRFDTTIYEEAAKALETALLAKQFHEGISIRLPKTDWPEDRYSTPESWSGSDIPAAAKKRAPKIEQSNHTPKCAFEGLRYTAPKKASQRCDERRLSISSSGQDLVDGPSQPGPRKSQKFSTMNRSKDREGDRDSLDELFDDLTEDESSEIIVRRLRYKMISSKGFMKAAEGKRQWCYQVLWKGEETTWEPVAEMKTQYLEVVNVFERLMKIKNRHGPRTRAVLQKKKTI
ncbi:hypothetical protein VTL71DRAFT_4494 [Oculimacula yallundae]|uniref:Chromo domain-containing protein n=1 Tax=Oculimacula yallundae TaxID=86028 RepID=A0ABR4C2R3_9HELO